MTRRWVVVLAAASLVRCAGSADLDVVQNDAKGPAVEVPQPADIPSVCRQWYPSNVCRPPESHPGVATPEGGWPEQVAVPAELQRAMDAAPIFGFQDPLPCAPVPPYPDLQ